MDERFEKVGSVDFYAVKSEIFLRGEVVQDLEKIIAADPDFDLDVFITFAVCDRIKEKVKNL